MQSVKQVNFRKNPNWVLSYRVSQTLNSLDTSMKWCRGKLNGTRAAHASEISIQERGWLIALNEVRRGKECRSLFNLWGNLVPGFICFLIQ